MIRRAELRSGRRELRAAARGSKGITLAVLLFSSLVNLLMLAGPLYMLQVYDRVLPSRSTATLVALTIILVVAFTGMGILDHMRARLATRIGMSFLASLEPRVLEASLDLARTAPGDPKAAAAVNDLESVQRFCASPVLLALCDIPWVPVFGLLIFVFHPLLGWLALTGSVILVGITLLNQWTTREPSNRAVLEGLKAERMAASLRSEMETVRGLGMQQAARERWTGLRAEARRHSLAASDISGGWSVMTKTFRLLLQSLMLGAGAWLVLQDQIGAGAMIASSILMGRALAPIETAIGQWSVATRAREGWRRLSELLSIVPPPVARTALPRPEALVEVRDLALYVPGEAAPILRNVSLKALPGQAVGVIGPSGAGKSSLARALTGLWPATGGEIRLGGATLEQYDPGVLGRHVGYLPQRVALFDGTIAENVARLSPAPDPDMVVRAARKAGAHELILTLPQGYDTPVSAVGSRLSGGQMQRVGLARALYGDPVLLVLDEPNSNLDSDGTLALNAAIQEMKAAGGVTFIMAHRPAAIQECDMLLLLEDGTRRAFGPRDLVLRAMVRNHADIAPRGVA